MDQYLKKKDDLKMNWDNEDLETPPLTSKIYAHFPFGDYTVELIPDKDMEFLKVMKLLLYQVDGETFDEDIDPERDLMSELKAFLVDPSDKSFEYVVNHSVDLPQSSEGLSVVIDDTDEDYKYELTATSYKYLSAISYEDLRAGNIRTTICVINYKPDSPFN